MLVRLVLERYFASSGFCCHSGLGKTSVPLVMSNPSWCCLISCITSLCTLSCWYPSRAANSSHSSLPPGLQRRRSENCVGRTGLVRLVLGDVDAFPDGRGELWVTSLAILACCRPCCNSCPEFVELSVVFEKSRCSRPSSWRSASGPYFSDTDFTSAFDSSILPNCGCPYSSLQLALRAHTHTNVVSA